MGRSVIVCGQTGAGKTTYSIGISGEMSAVRFSIDSWMQTLFSQDMQSLDFSWMMERVERCQDQIRETSGQILAKGGDVVLDLGFTTRAQRRVFVEHARSLGVTAEIHYVSAPQPVRKQRVAKRNAEKDPSVFSFEVTDQMFDFMEPRFEIPEDSELDGGEIHEIAEDGTRQNTQAPNIHRPGHTAQLFTLDTPCLLIDEAKMMCNIERLAERARTLGVELRPHLKTGKSVDVARRVLTGGTGPATVSTLAEAEVFAAAGVNSIVYAVGIAPSKLDRVIALRRGGCDLVVILDSVAQAEAVAAASNDSGSIIPAMIEIDSDGHRGGLRPDDPLLIATGRSLHAKGAELRGVLTHAGESYGAVGRDAQAVYAEEERAAVVAAAEVLRANDLPCPVVSVGSTPTAHAASDLKGVTELRAGVYVFFDLVMAGIGVCTLDDIALSVLTTVIGHQPERDWLIVDAGWMALSRDRGTASQSIDQGYGVVCDLQGNVLPDLIVLQANQEHGVIGCRPGSGGSLPELGLGTRLRILPNHACATAAQHRLYNLVPSTGNEPLLRWPRFGGW